MRASEKLAFNKALELSRASTTDPGIATANARAINQLLSVIAPSVAGDPVPTRIVVPVTFPSVQHTTIAAVPSDYVTVDWPRDGWCVGIAATVAEGEEHRTKIGMSIRIEGDEALISSQRSEAYAALSLLCGGDTQHHAFPFRRRVRVRDTWQVKFKVLAPPLTSGGPNFYTPLVMFLFEAEADEQ